MPNFLVDVLIDTSCLAEAPVARRKAGLGFRVTRCRPNGKRGDIPFASLRKADFFPSPQK